MFKRQLRTVWWMHPAIALGIPTVLVAIAALVTSPQSYFFYWRTGKFVETSDVLTAFAGVAAFVVGAFAGKARRPQEELEPGPSWSCGIPWDSVRTLFNTCFGLCLVGYLLWTGVALRNGLTLGTVLDAMRGDNGATYDVHLHYLVPVAGVTSLTQFGIAAVAFGIPLGIATGWRGVRWKLLLLIGLGVFRALINSERLAVIELMVPGVISYIWHRSARISGVSHNRRWLVPALPILAVAILFVFFSAAEYQRSWLNFYAAHESSFLRFAVLRFAGYYTTAFNNGALLLHSMNPLGAPWFTALFARHFPILNSVFDALFPVGYSGEDVYSALLASLANPELNNPGGICLPAIDFGVTGAFVYWLLCGFVCGYVYKSFIHFSPVGMFLYPILFTSLLETPRVLYWADGRVFPSLFIVIVSTLFVLNRPRVSLATRVPILS